MPPSCAIVIASFASVTVSIAADKIGVLSEIFLVSCVLRLTSLGIVVECAGTNKTSSNVSAVLSKFIIKISSELSV